MSLRHLQTISICVSVAAIVVTLSGAVAEAFAGSAYGVVSDLVFAALNLAMLVANLRARKDYRP